MIDRERLTVLIADAEMSTRRATAEALEAAGFAAAQSGSVADAMARIEGFAYDGLIVDVRLSDGDGLDVLDQALVRYPQMRCIVTAGFGSIHHAVRALKRGALDFLIKPCQGAQLADILRAPEMARRTGIAPTAPSMTNEPLRTRLVGSGPAMKRLHSVLERVSPMLSTVLIQGETGTGKELVARTIHENSPRRDQPFVAFNAAAIPDGLAEAELFGHVKGAFTGAVYARVGRFEAADRGTLFIDEVSSMPMSLQAKLLRALQEREIERVGTSRPLKINARVVAASNMDLREMVKAGTFREDLYYRLNVVRVELPALRERKDDIPSLARHFVKLTCEENGLPVKTLSQSTLRLLMECPWPGNIRQLQNALEHAVAMSGSADVIDADTFPGDIQIPEQVAATEATALSIPKMPEEGINFASTMSQVERELILRYLEKAGGNKRRAARLLQLSRTTLIDKLQRLGVGETAAVQVA